MTAINFGLKINEITKRHKRDLMSVVSSLPDAELNTLSKVTLEIDSSKTVVPTKLFACYTNNVNILIHITVDGNTITIPLTSWLLLPFDPGQNVSIVIENPEDNPVLIDAVVSYLTV